MRRRCLNIFGQKQQTQQSFFKTPFEASYGYKPSLSFLKVFGCVCFGHVPQVKRDKLDKKAISGIFVGYSSVSKAYKVYHPQSGKVIVSRDVHFNEDQQWDWKNPQRTIGSFNNIGNDHLEKQTTELCENELEDDPPPLEAQGCCLTSINSAM